METTLARLGALAPQLHAGQTARAGIAPEEFEEIVRLNQRRIYRVLLGLVRDPDAAETLTQECFLRAYQKRNGFRRESSVGTWLVRIAVNLAIDHVGNRRNAFWRRLFGGAKPEAAALAARELPDPRAFSRSACAPGPWGTRLARQCQARHHPRRRIRRRTTDSRARRML